MKKVDIKNKYEAHYIITLFVMLLILLLSIVPILPISVYIGTIDKRIPIYQTQVNVYYAYFFTLIENGNVQSFIYAFGILAFYVSALIAIIYLFLGDKKNTKIWLLICSLSHVLGIISLSYISIFSTISLTITLSLLIIDYYFDRRNRLYEYALLNHKHELMKQLGNVIKEARIEKGLTQQELADKVFVSRTLIAKTESGSYLPNKKIIEDLSIILEISLIDVE